MKGNLRFLLCHLLTVLLLPPLACEDPSPRPPPVDSETNAEDDAQELVPELSTDDDQAQDSKPELDTLPDASDILETEQLEDAVDVEEPEQGPPWPAEPIAPAAPVLAVAPVFTPCPPGWVEGVLYQTPICSPWAGPTRPVCAPGSMLLPGQPECVQVHTDCGDGWPTDLPPGASLRFVAPGAPPGGNGTRESPHSSVDTAALLAAPGDIIVLHRGQHTLSQPIRTELILWGACRDSILTGTLNLQADTLTLRNLTLAQKQSPPTLSVRSGVLRLENVELDFAAGGELWADGGRLELDNVLANHILIGAWGGSAKLTRVSWVNPSDWASYVDTEGTMELEDVSYFGGPNSNRGLSVINGHATLRRAYFRDFAGIPLVSEDSLLAEDVVVEHTTPRADGSGGWGLYAGENAALELRRIRIHDSARIGAGILEPAHPVTFEDVMITDTAINGASKTTNGLYLRAVQGQVSRLLLANNGGYGLMVSRGAPSFDDVTLLANRQAADGFAHAAFFLDNQITMRRVVLRENAGGGITTSNPGSRLLIEDLTATDGKLGNTIATSAMVAYAVLGAHLTLERAALSDNREYGIGAAKQNSSLLARDLRIERTGKGHRSDRGGAIYAENASLTLERFALSDNHAFSVIARSSTVNLKDGRIDTTTLGGSFGHALLVQENSTLTGERLGFRHNAVVNVLAHGSNSELRLSELSIGEPSEQRCVSQCSGAEDGIVARDGATIDVDTFVISSCQRAGVAIEAGAEVDLHHGRILAHGAGALIEDPNYALDRLRDDVLFAFNRDNFVFNVLWMPAILD